MSIKLRPSLQPNGCVRPAVIKHCELDFKTQLDAGFPSYLAIASAVFTALPPDMWGIFLLLAAGFAYAAYLG